MTDLTLPAEINGAADPEPAAHAWAKSGTGAWVVEDSELAHLFPVDEAALDAFDHVASEGLDVTISPGEAYVYGWLVRDEETTLTLDDDTTTDIWLGWDIDAILGEGEAPADSENIIIGPEADFDPADPRTLIWTFETGGGSVTDETDHRILEQPMRYEPRERRTNATAAPVRVRELQFEPHDGPPEDGEPWTLLMVDETE